MLLIFGRPLFRQTLAALTRCCSSAGCSEDTKAKTSLPTAWRISGFIDGLILTDSITRGGWTLEQFESGTGGCTCQCHHDETR